ncbi:cupin domain-containing protein [Solimicrobium silvestre]|uniref:ChrR-like cupin domain-containing protein n=1 Tax=Solimicrobium silvestre TaxID=2099400 RepID=A0A2S9H4I2_9BURK|nr:cupin domain-containing protein [Solimicrobium silvestre]PRC94894.1 hypothetical protein S2091_0089 [Solimicrobium silvestre]
MNNCLKNCIQSSLLRSFFSICSTLLFSFTLISTSYADDSTYRTELNRTDFSGTPNMEIVSSIVEFKPGDFVHKHFHHGVESAYVLQGAMIQEPGKKPRMLATGTPLLNQRDVMHGGFTIVGDTNLKIFTVHVVDKNKPLYDEGK